MSTLDRPGARATPLLVDGQRLDRATFHERYRAMPTDTRAELVGGVVSMPSPLGYDHGQFDAAMTIWLGSYARLTPGVGVASNATVQLGDEAEVQPDTLLRLDERRGGQSRIAGGYIVGPPELIVEVAATSQVLDLGPKKNQYERSGVLEYLVVSLEPAAVRWFARRDGRLEVLAPDADGLYRSEVFPGLWLDPAALLARDLDGLVRALERGLATPEHAAFVDRLK